VLEGAGQRVVTHRRDWPAGLSDREVEVLGLLARGLTMKEIAQRLVISPKTVDHHIQHIYTKVDVRTRPAARL
jgi:DNA-binding NarL/FixJ family response regulator